MTSFFVLISRHGSAAHIYFYQRKCTLRNLNLFSIVAVDNHQLAQIIESKGTPVVGMFSFYSILQAQTYSWWLAVFISIVDAIQ